VGTLFGRERELARIDRALEGARAGQGTLLLLTGEPGIGKSSLAREAGVRATQAGMRVVAGRCWEGGGAAPYWPWVQIFRGLGDAPFEDLIREEGGDSAQRRFQLFDAATRALTARAAREPLLLFLDDLHAADLPSLSLLLFLARQVAASGLLVLGTSREVELRLSPELGEAMTKLAREGEVMSLSRLTRDDVAAWLAHSEPLVPEADDVFRVTEGNPLFVRELLRVGGRAARRPTSGAGEGIRGALDESLARLSAEARATLEPAAVLGRDFGTRELAELAASPHDVVLAQLRHASELGVVEATERERFAFTHVLLRDRLYQSLPPVRRSQLHWAAGLVAERHDADATRAANHLLEGADAGDVERAAEAALRAAQQALRSLAFEAAATLAERALALMGHAPSRLACRLEITCGEGLIRSGATEPGRERCVRASEWAKGLGSAEDQAEAALVYACEVVGGPIVDPVMVRLLEEALAAVGTEDSALAARLGARLSAALMPPRTEEGAEDILRLGSAALAMARRLDDPETLLYALDFARSGLAQVISNDERFELIRETASLARRLERRLTSVTVAPSHTVGLLERGRRADADAALAELVALDAALDNPYSRWRLSMLRVGFCFFDGRLDEVERLSDEALGIGERFNPFMSHLEWAGQRMALAIARGAPASIAPVADRVLSMLSKRPILGATQAWVLAAIGRGDEAARALRQVAAITQGPATLLYAADACALLDDREAAAWIEAQLRKRSFGVSFFWGSLGGYAHGPLPRALGELARVLGRTDEARAHYQDAIALCRRINAKPFLALSEAALARLDGPAARPREQPARPGPREISLRREGDVWAVGGSSAPPFRLKHSKGLAYLNELLAHPGQELHVLVLVGMDHGAGDAGPVLDARAKAAYRDRLDALEDELAEAEKFGDAGRATRARAELEALATQLAGAVGLGGRDRRAASDAERARINVQRRLKDAIDGISACDADLGRYLGVAVKTGTYCSFTPL
jgi:tetratricopeptide (TPR) repeat protein